MSLQFHAVSSDGLWLDHTFVTGATVLLGNWTDGPGRVLELSCGSHRPERGDVTLDGKSLFAAPQARATVGTLFPAESVLGAGLTADWLERVALLRGLSGNMSNPAECLGRIGAESLLARKTRTLTSIERRKVALAAALGLPAPRVLALADPFGIPGVERATLAQLLSEVATRAIVLVATPHLKDALTLAATTCTFSNGRLLTRPFRADEEQPTPHVRYRVTTNDPARLMHQLLASPMVDRVQVPQHTRTLEVAGTNARGLSLAILRASLDCGARIENLIEAPLDLDALQAAARGRADGTYAAAYQASAVPATSASSDATAFHQPGDSERPAETGPNG
jgi:ABC-type thiamine transport system ATPase subunit